MFGYPKADIDNMKYGVDCSLMLINANENPAIHRYLKEASDFFEGLIEEAAQLA